MVGGFDFLDRKVEGVGTSGQESGGGVLLSRQESGGGNAFLNHL